MIESLVSPLVKKFDDFIRQERKFLGERSERLLSLRNSLEQLMLCSVKRVKEGEHEDGVHLEDVVDHVHKVDDFIDYLIFDFGKSRSDAKLNSERGKCSINIASSLQNFVKHQIFPQIDSNVVSLKTKLDKFYNKKAVLVQIDSLEFLNPYSELQTEPVNPTPSLGVPDQYFMIGVVGISSSAKSAMVQAMLDSQKEYFEKHIFARVNVSEYYEIQNLLRSLIKEFKMQDEELDMMGTEELGLYLYESLMKCPYLLVLEDLSDPEVWAQLRRALPNNKLGSQVFITTRIRSLLIEKSGGERTQIYELPVENFTTPEIYTIFNSSFDDLHHLLKLCYLYLGLFPENSEIKVDKLIKLWVAEGFIKSGKGGTLEEVAMDYMNELADRSLIKVAKRNETRIDTFWVDPCLTALILSKSGELKLLKFVCPLENPSQNVSDITYRTVPRRLASHFGFRKDFTIDHLARTLMVFSKNTDTITKESKVNPFMKLTLLQVLDLEGTWFPASRETGKTTLPNAIGKLILLRYLGLNDTYIDDIPPFIKNLQALQTLYVDRDILVSIPNEINELKQLRHLYGRLKWPFKINNLSQLQTLGHIEIIYWRFILNMDLVMLKELYVVFTNMVYHSAMKAIGILTNLQTLYIKINDFVDLKPLSNCRKLLQLKLKGEITELPPNMPEIFPNLKYLYISHYNKKTPLPLKNLAKLPKLTILDLCHLSIDEKVEAESFPQLEILQLIKCKFEALSFDETTMPHLKELLITDRNDDNIPQRLKSLPKPKHWGRSRDDDWPYFPRTMS